MANKNSLAQVHTTPEGGFSSLQGYPKLTITGSASGFIDLLPDNTYFASSVQFIPEVHKVFSVNFEYETCDDDGGPIWHSADGVAFIAGKTPDSYSSLSSLPIGSTLGVVNDGKGFAIQLKTYGWSRGIYLIDGNGTVLKKVADRNTYTDCGRVPVEISVDQNGLLSFEKGEGSQRIEFTYTLPQALFDSLEGKSLAFSAATGAADSAHVVNVTNIGGIFGGGGGGDDGSFGNPDLSTDTGVCFYTDANYQGDKGCFDFDPNYAPENNQAFFAGSFNDRISSIEIVGNVEVRYCEDVFFQGTCHTTSSSIAQLDATSDNTMSSFQMDKVRDYSNYTIHIISGNDQSGDSYSIFINPLVVEVRDQSSAVLPNVSVIFEAQERDWVRGASTGPNTQYVVRTDSSGRAEAYWNPNRQSTGAVNLSTFVYNRISQTKFSTVQFRGNVNNVPLLFTAPTNTCSNQFNDPLFKYQWHLNNAGQRNFATVAANGMSDINICPAYGENILGQGVIVGVVDSGAELKHEDLASRFVPNGSINFVTGTNDPTNTFTTGGDHGTSVAGIIVAASDNNKGGVGVAPMASLKAFNPLESGNPDTDIIRSLGGDPLSQDVSVFNMSFGIPFSKPAPKPTSSLAILERVKNSTQNLRSGKGSLFVHALGNSFDFMENIPSGDLGDDEEPVDVCRRARDLEVSCHIPSADPDGFYPWAIGVGAINASGKKSSYSSAGSNIWVSTPSGGSGFDNAAYPDTLHRPLDDESVLPGILTPDQSTCQKGYASTVSGSIDNYFQTNASGLNPNCNYTASFNGTSAASPVAAGVVALLLDANSNLTWRDIKYILAKTSSKIDSGHTAKSKQLADQAYTYRLGWVTNTANFNFNNWYGFGLTDVDAAITLAKSYTSPFGANFSYDPTWDAGTVSASVIKNNHYAQRGKGTVSISSTENRKIESAQIKLYVRHPFPGDLSVQLTSPSGTKSILLNLANGADGYDNLGDSTDDALILTTNAFYMEDSQGQWSLDVIDGFSHTEGDGDKDGTLVSWGIRFFGAQPKQSN